MKRLLIILFVTTIFSGCHLLPVKLVEDKTVSNKDWKMDIHHIIDKGGASIGHVVYVAPRDTRFMNVFLSITNTSKTKAKMDLRHAYLVEGERGVRASMYLIWEQLTIIDEIDPVSEIEPGKSIGRNLVYAYPEGKMPTHFVLKGIGVVKIPKKTDEKKK